MENKKADKNKKTNIKTHHRQMGGWFGWLTDSVASIAKKKAK